MNETLWAVVVTFVLIGLLVAVVAAIVGGAHRASAAHLEDENVDLRAGLERASEVLTGLVRGAHDEAAKAAERHEKLVLSLVDRLQSPSAIEFERRQLATAQAEAIKKLPPEVVAAQAAKREIDNILAAEPWKDHPDFDGKEVGFDSLTNEYVITDWATHNIDGRFSPHEFAEICKNLR